MSAKAHTHTNRRIDELISSTNLELQAFSRKYYNSVRKMWDTKIYAPLTRYVKLYYIQVNPKV